MGWRPLVTFATVCVYKFNEIHAVVGQMPNCREFSMQFYGQRFPSSALTDRSIYTQKNLFRINGWGPQQLPPQFGSINPTKITQLAGYIHYSREFSMQFYHQRFPSSALTVRSICTQKNFFRINGWGPSVTSATVWVYRSTENHAAGMVYAQEQGIFNAIVQSTLPEIRID